MYGAHAIIDETSETLYAFESDEELNNYIGRRVSTATWHLDTRNGAVEGGPPLLEFTRVGVDLNEDRVVDEVDNEVSDAARDASNEVNRPVLSATGGFPVPFLGAALLLPAVGLLVRCALR